MRILSIEELNQIERKLTHHTTEETYYDGSGTWVYEWRWEGWEGLADGDTRPENPQIIEGLGKVYVMTDTYTGNEGGGEDIQIVFRIEPEDGSEEFWVRKDGRYYSYDGSSWNGTFYQVQPVQVMVNKYEMVK